MHEVDRHRPHLLRLTLLMTAVALGACGGGDDTPSTTAAAPVPSATAPTPAPAAPAPVPAPPAPAPTPVPPALAPTPAPPAPAPTPAPPAPSPTPAGWGSATVRSAALSADRVIEPNLLPTLEWENTSLGLGRQLSMARSANPLQGNAGQDIVGVRYVAATGQVLTVSVALVPDPSQPVGSANSVWSCGPCTGVSVDLAAGSVTFVDTPLTPTALSGTQQPATLSGTYGLPDWRPRTGTTVTAAALAACVLSSNPTGATFADIGCLNGTYVGTGIEGQACTVQIDTAAQTFRFDDGVKVNTFGFSSSGGFTNLGTFRSAFTQSATLSRPGVPLENISLQASPSAVAPDITTVELRNIQSEGGTLNAVYSRACRIEFDRRAP